MYYVLSLLCMGLIPKSRFEYQNKSQSHTSQAIGIFLLPFLSTIVNQNKTICLFFLSLSSGVNV